MGRNRALVWILIVAAIVILGLILLSSAISNRRFAITSDDADTAILEPHSTPFGLPTMTPAISQQSVTPQPTLVQTAPMETETILYCVLFLEPTVQGLQLGYRHLNPKSPSWRTTCCKHGFVSIVNGLPLVRQANITSTIDVPIDGIYDPSLCQQ